jgi:hypothetical protein
MHFFILQTELRHAVLFGPIGLSLWSAFAGSCNRGSRVDGFPLQTSIIMLSPWLRFPISRSATICMRNCHGNQETRLHKRGLVRRIVSKFVSLISFWLSCWRSWYSDPTCMLLHPHVANPVIDNGLFSKILVCLATRYNKTVRAVRQCLSAVDIELWGKVNIVGGGDTIVASSLGTSSQGDSRNATYVRVSISFISFYWRLTNLGSIFSTNYLLTRTRDRQIERQSLCRRHSMVSCSIFL